MKIKKIRKDFGGSKEFYSAQIVDNENVNMEKLCKKVEEQVGIPYIRSLSVISAFVKLMSSELLKGNMVKIEGLGYFTISVTCNKNVTAINKIAFRVAKELKAEYDKATFEEVNE